MRVLGGREDNPQPEVEQEVISKYEQEPEFRNFIKNLLRCRSLASLDINKDAKAEEEEKTARQEKQNDDIERRPVGRGRAQERRRNHQAQLSQRGRTEEERSGRGEPGENGPSRFRPMSDIYREDQVSNNNAADSPLEFNRTDRQHRYSTMTLPRKEKRASVILRERHEMMISEREERQAGVFTLPRVSCYHRSTRF